MVGLSGERKRYGKVRGREKLFDTSSILSKNTLNKNKCWRLKKMDGIKMEGEVKSVCESLKALAKEFPHWTVAQLTKYMRVIEAERRQFEGARI